MLSTRIEKLSLAFVVIVGAAVGASGVNREVGDPILVAALVIAFAAIAISERRTRRNSPGRLGPR
jgi:uncharacterized membrane protein